MGGDCIGKLVSGYEVLRYRALSGQLSTLVHKFSRLWRFRWTGDVLKRMDTSWSLDFGHYWWWWTSLYLMLPPFPPCHVIYNFNYLTYLRNVKTRPRSGRNASRNMGFWVYLGLVKEKKSKFHKKSIYTLLSSSLKGSTSARAIISTNSSFAALLLMKGQSLWTVPL